MSQVTQILEAIRCGETKAAEELLPLIYAELRRLAAHRMATENPGQTLQPTALVHEAWLRLAGDENRKWKDSSHFFAAAAECMRRILVDNARRKRARRHGGDHKRTEMPEIASAVQEGEDNVLLVNDALNQFARLDPDKAELVKLRYFVGMTLEEAAQALGISERTAKRHWAFARAWLQEEIAARQAG